MRVCYFGQYDLNYSRNNIIRQGLNSLGVEVINCQVDIKVQQRVPKYSNLIRKYFSVMRSIQAIIVAETNHPIMFLAKLLADFSHVPLVFDPFISRYDTLVIDRQSIPADTKYARYLYWIDRLSMNLADNVLADTFEHGMYYKNSLHTYRPITVVPIGANNKIFNPRTPTNVKRESFDTLKIIFWGTFIPLQGIQYILEAAAILQQNHIHVNIIIAGNGQTYLQMHRIAENLELSNVTFLDFIPLIELPKYICDADLVLGIFGDTAKAQRVVPNKLYEGLAMAKPVITGASPAIFEFFHHAQHLHTVPMADPEALAEAIIYLKKNPEYRHHLAQQGYEYFMEQFTPEHIGQHVQDVLEKLI